MSYASIAGRAKTSSTNPQAHAICDKCGFRFNFVDLHWQMDYRGPVIQNLRILVCKPCMDVPQSQLRAIVVPADPEPIINARPEDFQNASSNYRAISQTPAIDPMSGLPIPNPTLRTTMDCQNRVTQETGRPPGLDQNAVMPLTNGIVYGVKLPVMSVVGDGVKTVTVTCSAVHNLQPNSQVSANGLSVFGANGFFSVNVLTATVFTYQTYGTVPASSLLTGGTRIITGIAGLPLGMDTIPQVGP